MSEQYIFGLHPVIELLKSGGKRARHVYLSASKKGPQFEEIISLARRDSVRLSRVSDRELDVLTEGGNHQGVVLKADEPALLSLEEALAAENIGKETVWVGLDEITDPQNLGAIIRSAACLGATAVVLPERRSAGITPTVQKTASGAVELMKIISVVNLNQAVLTLKERGFWVYGASLDGKPINEVSFSGPVFLLIGSEGKGLREKTAEHCDELVRIPQKGGVQSLNASCACAVILYEITRRKS